MSETGIILIRDGALLPPNFLVESENFLPGWRMLKHVDGYTFNRRIREANWNFVRLTGEYKAKAVGRAYPGILRKAVLRILAGLRGRKFKTGSRFPLEGFLGLASSGKNRCWCCKAANESDFLFCQQEKRKG